MRDISLNALAQISYRPQAPKEYRPKIGLVGCGGITGEHLQAYRNANLEVSVLCDLNLEAAKKRQAEFYPAATVCENYQDLLQHDEVEIVDIAVHPQHRPQIIEDCLCAGRHVLSQKPFVLDLDVGQRLVELAKQQNRYLAVNQNGRWAPHFSLARQVAQSGFIGRVFGAHLSCHWDHTWTAGTAFERIRHLILYDYAIHWFDIVRCFFDSEAQRVFASMTRAPEQKLMPPLLAQAAIEFEEGQATLAFDAALPYGSHDRTFLSGTTGAYHSYGTDIQHQSAYITSSAGTWNPRLTGQWFPDGFQGVMGELLCAIEENRRCSVDAEDNLHSLALCFAAIASAESGQSVVPGTVRSLPS